VEQRDIHGRLNIGGNLVNPVRSRNFLSRSREELLRRAGSRYSSASGLGGLTVVTFAPLPFVVVGAAQLKAFEATPIQLGSIALTVMRLGGITSALKVLMRHGLRVQ